jgi:hypothetical protein
VGPVDLRPHAGSLTRCVRADELVLDGTAEVVPVAEDVR